MRLTRTGRLSGRLRLLRGGLVVVARHRGGVAVPGVLRGGGFCEQRPRYLLRSATGKRQALLPAGPMIDERTEEREIICQVLEHALEIALEPQRARARLGVRRVAPRRELTRDDL